MTVTELTRPLNSSSTSAVRPERKPDIPWYTIGGDPEDVVWVSRLVDIGFAIYPLSLEHARTLLEFLRQEDLKTLENLLVERAAAFDDLRQILIEEREATVDVRFVVTGDLYRAETVVLQWIQDLREALQHLELDFIILPPSASPIAEWSNGGKVLYEHRGRPHRQGPA
jgi:hypothetical protein